MARVPSTDRGRWPIHWLTCLAVRVPGHACNLWGQAAAHHQAHPHRRSAPGFRRCAVRLTDLQTRPGCPADLRKRPRAVGAAAGASDAHRASDRSAGDRFSPRCDAASPAVARPPRRDTATGRPGQGDLHGHQPVPAMGSAAAAAIRADDGEPWLRPRQRRPSEGGATENPQAGSEEEPSGQRAGADAPGESDGPDGTGHTGR